MNFFACRWNGKAMPEALVGIVLICSLVFVSCKDNSSGPQNTTSPLAGVTNLLAYSAGATSVGLTWTASANASLSDYANIQVNVKTGSTLDSTYTFAAGAVSAVIPDLTEGTVYSFEVIGLASSSSTSYTNSNPAVIDWAPARRLDTDNNGVPIKVYESSSSSSYGSGLIIYDAGAEAPRVVSISNPGADSTEIDLYLRTHPTSVGSVMLRSASLFRSTWRLTLFSTDYRERNSLDDAALSPPDTNSYTATEIQFDSAAVSSGKIVYYKTDAGNYGRMLVQQAPNNTLVWGSSPEQYLNLRISYQTVPYNRFSKR